MGPLAILTCATLVLTAFHPGLAASLVIFSLSAAFGSYQIAANTAFVIRTPDERRAQALGICQHGRDCRPGYGLRRGRGRHEGDCPGDGRRHRGRGWRDSSPRG